MILTHTGMLGDFITSLIIPNYYWKHRKEKTTFILSEWFRPVVGLEEFLMLQDFTEKVVFDPFMSEFTPNGAQPYKFKPESIGDDEVYYNLGIGSIINKYLGIVYAREHGLGFDMDITLKYLDPDFPEELRGQKLYTPFTKERYDKHMYDYPFNQLLPSQGYVPLDFTKPLLHNLNLAHYSQETVFYPNGFSVLVNLCGIPTNYPGAQCRLINSSTREDAYYLSKNPCVGVSGAQVIHPTDPLNEEEFRHLMEVIHNVSSHEMKTKSDVIELSKEIYWMFNRGSAYISRAF